MLLFLSLQNSNLKIKPSPVLNLVLILLIVTTVVQRSWCQYLRLMLVLKGWSRVQLLKRDKNKSSSILKNQRPLPSWLGGACACQPAQLWEYNVHTSACLNSLGRDVSDFLMGKWREWEMLHIEPAHPRQSANQSETWACWEQAGYKYDVTTTTPVRAARSDGWLSGKRQKTRRRVERTGDTEHVRQRWKAMKVRPSLGICFTSVNTETTQGRKPTA